MVYSQVFTTAIDNPTVTAGGYSANDVVGGCITLEVKSPTNTGQMQVLHLEDVAYQSMALDVWFFSDIPYTTGTTLIADNGAFATAATIGMLQKRITRLQIAAADWTTVNSIGYVDKFFSPVCPYTTDQYGNIYAYFICTGTPTLTALCFTIRLTVLMD